MNNVRVTIGENSRSFRDQENYDNPRQNTGGYRGNYHSGAMRNHSSKYQTSNRRTTRGGGGAQGRGGGVQGHYTYKARNRGRGAGPRSRFDEDFDGDARISEPGPSQGYVKRHSPYGSSRGRNNRRPLAMDHPGEEVLHRLGLPVGDPRERRGGRGRGGRGPRYSTHLTGGPTAWFKVTCPHGAKYERNYILTLLTNASSQPFIPKRYTVYDKDSFFFIQGSDAAQALQGVSGKVTTDKGFKLYVSVRPSNTPKIYEINAEVLEKLKVVLSNRYDVGTKSLNLSDLQHDEELKKQDICLSMYKKSVVDKVLEIIHENIPELETLDLRNNNLTTLHQFSQLHVKAPNLIRLNLGQNQIVSDAELRTFSKLPVVELYMDGNPLCDKYSDEDSYVSAIRKKFPKVMKLDGHDLPPPIVFDVETEIELPPSQGSCFGENADVKNLVCQFVQQYFTLYDTGRSQLLDAYHDQATFSLGSYTNDAISGWQPKLSDYSSHSRNLMKINEPALRQKKLIKGRINIVQLLGQLPKTEHDLSSFVVDVIFLSSSMLTFSISGMYREVLSDTSRTYIRCFSRVFVTVPQGSGVAILNEQFTLTNPQHNMQKKAFSTTKTPQASTSQAGVPSLTPEQKAQLTRQFSNQSGMNADWSAKCLQENNWDYELAAKMFTDLQSKGSIPPEAFKK